MSLSVIIIGFLIGASSLNIVSTQAQLDTSENQHNIDSFDRFAWKWSTTEVVSTESTSNSFSSSLAVGAAGNVHIAWYDGTSYGSSGSDWDIFYKRWDASTSTWTTTEVVSTESTSGSYDPSLAVDAAGNVHIAWLDYTDYAGAGSEQDIFYKRWDASTTLWSTTEVVSTASTGSSSTPSLAVEVEGNVHIAGEDLTSYGSSGSDYDIFYKCWDASTSTWTTTEVVSTESTSGSYDPSLAVDAAGNVHIAWHDYTDYGSSGPDQDIFYKRWDASSSSWTTTEVVSTESTSLSSYTSLAVGAAGNVHIAWYDGTVYAGAGTDWDIFYKRWDASTSTWTTTEVVSTESTGDSYNPSLATDAAGNMHIAWRDGTDYAGAGTDADIFYKLLICSPPAPELAFIVPNPTELDSVFLDWNNISRATSYYVYRSDYYIWSVEELEPVAEVQTSFYFDSLPSQGHFYYVIVAGNLAGNSSHSNCEYIEYKLPTLNEFIIISSLIIGIPVLLFLVARIRKKNTKQS